MKINTQIHHIIPPLDFVERGDSSLIDFSTTERSIRVRSYAGNLAEIEGEILDTSPVSGTITKAMLKLFCHAINKWPQAISNGRSIIVDLTEHRLSAFPLDNPMFHVSVPLGRALDSSAAIDEWTNAVIVHSGKDLSVFRDLIRPPSTREPAEGVTRIEIEPRFINMYTFDGHVLAHHQMYIRSDGYLTSDVKNSSLKKALSTSFRIFDNIKVQHRGDAVSISKDGLEITIDAAQSEIFEQALKCLDSEHRFGEIRLNTEHLFDLCKGVIKVGSQYIDIDLDESMARMADTNHIRPLGYQLLSEAEQKKVGIAVKIMNETSALRHVVKSLTIDANDLVGPLKVLFDDEEITISVLGEERPEYLSLRGFDDYPRFGIRIQERIGG